jgi:hypothetical protein
MNGFRRPSGSLTSLAAAAMILTGLGTEPARAQVRTAVWFSIQSAAATDFTQQIERFVTTVLRRRFPGLPLTPATRDVVYRQLASQAPGDLVFISGTAADVRSLVTDDRLGVVGKLNLELINVSIGAAPFFLLTRADQVAAIRNQTAPPPRVVYAPRAGPLQPNDVQSLLAKVLGRRPTVATALNSPDELARRLLSDATIVGIYDVDPSPFLHEFLEAYRRQRAGTGATGDTQLIQMIGFSGGGATDPLQGQLQPLEANLAFAVVAFDDFAVERLQNVGPAKKDNMLAVSAGPLGAGADAVWVLSNVRRVAGDAEYLRVRQLLGNAYYAALFDRQDFAARCRGGVATQYSPYLLDAHLGDRQSIPKGLALWSDLVLRLGTVRRPDADTISDQLTLVEALLRERLDVQLGTSTGRSALAGKLRGPRGTVRQQFSDAQGTLFEQAVKDISTALNARDAATRQSRFAAARAKLLALIEKGDGPACKGRDLGLFGRGLDPYFYLSLVDAYLALDGATGT